MAGAGNHFAVDECRERGALGRRIARRRSEAVVASVEHDGGSFDFRTPRQPAFDFHESWFTGRVPVAVAIGMDDRIHEIRIVERRCRPVERFIGEAPGGRPRLPQQAANTAAMTNSPIPPSNSSDRPSLR